MIERMESFPTMMNKVRFESQEYQNNLNTLISNKQLFSVENILCRVNWNTIPSLDNINPQNKAQLHSHLNK